MWRRTWAGPVSTLRDEPQEQRGTRPEFSRKGSLQWGMKTPKHFFLCYFILLTANFILLTANQALNECCIPMQALYKN